MASRGQEVHVTSAQKSRLRVRKVLNQIDNEQVRRARGLLRSLRHNPPDVVFFGDSTASFVGPLDGDQRRLRTMLDDGLGSKVVFRTIDGPSFSADIIDAYLRLLSIAIRPPVVVLPLWIRGRFPPWIEHPVHGHKQAISYIRSIDRNQPSWRVHARIPRPTPAQFDEFANLPYATFLGEALVGDYLSKIRSSRRAGDPEEAIRMLYAYHHGGLLTEDSPELSAVVRLGRTVAQLGCQAVVYQTPSPFEMGSHLWGEEMAQRTTASFEALNSAYRSGAGTEAEVIESGMMFSSDQFIDPSDATEHLNQDGRLPLAKLIVSAVRERLDRR
jgi:hypothetical protein